MPPYNVGGPGQTDGQPIRMTGNQVGGKGSDGNFHIFATDPFGVLQVSSTGGGTANFNLAQVGGTPISLGQTTMAASIPVTFASNQSALPVSGTVTSNQGSPNTIANSWPVEITNGTNILGTPANPIRIDPTGTTVQPVSISGTVPVSGTVTVNQGTSPWVTSLASTTITGSVAVTGTFFQATQPVSIAGTVAVTQSTSPWIVAGGGTAGSPGTAVLTIQGIAGGTAVPISGTVTVTPSGLQNVNLTQLNSVALGSPSNYGTSPGAVEVQGVNAFVTNTVATTLASTTITGTVAVTQSTSPWVVSLASTTVTGTVTVQGNLTTNNAAPIGNNVGVLPAVASTAAPTYTAGDQVLLSTDLAGNLRTTSTISGTSAFNLAQWAGTVLGTPTNYGTSPGAVIAGSVNAFVTNTVATTLASTTITGTVAVTQSTSPWVVSGTVTTTPPANASTNITQWDSTALGAPSAYGTSPGAVTVPGVNAFITNTVATTLASTTITGTVAVTQSTSPWVDNLTQVAGVALGATAVTNFGTAPAAAAVPGVNSSLFAGTTGITATGTSLNVNLTNSLSIAGALTNNNAAPTATLLGVLPAIAETAYATVTYTTGDMVLPVTDLHGALNTDLQAVAGAGVSISAAGMQKVGIAGGANGTTIDASIAAGTAPGNGLAILSVYNNTSPSLTTGQSVALQCDQNGSIFVKITRRSETKALSTTISTTTATAIVTAPGAGLFADLSSLIITVTPQGVTGEAFTVTVSDGTNSFIYDMFTGVTATLAPTQINASFNPPIPATTANTAWTATVSTITTQPVIHVTTLVILQKAS